VPYRAVREAPHGARFPAVAPTVVGPAQQGATARFDLLADDVAREMRDALDTALRPLPQGRPYRLTVRRSKQAMNSLGRRLPHDGPVNPCFAHPDDLAALDIADGDLLTITSDHGTITAVAVSDPTLRPGVLAMTHGYGGLPGEDDDPVRFGASPARLLSLTEHRQAVSLMPWMTAVPVSLRRTLSA
jgi:anaerobic selenocysteine-containing dehydrogenase